MSTPIFYPSAIYLEALPLQGFVTLRHLCQRAGITCKASGEWTGRKIQIRRGKALKIWAEPGDWGDVRIEMPATKQQEQAQLALAVLAYGLHDLVARESLRGIQWVRPMPPRGRPPIPRAMSTKERQRRFRAKRK